MKVEIYRNLHNNCWSVRDNKTGIVIEHVRHLHIKDATLVVRPAGRERVLQEGRKNVHAFVKGEVCTTGEVPLNICEVVYNPYKHSSFVEKVTGKSVYTATHIFLTSLGKAYMEVSP
jgi:hypothetical protein